MLYANNILEVQSWSNERLPSLQIIYYQVDRLHSTAIGGTGVPGDTREFREGDNNFACMRLSWDQRNDLNGS